MSTTKVVSPAAIVALKQALTEVYWYKPDLRSFLTSTLSDPRILSRLNWSDYKRNIVSGLVDHLAASPSHRDDLVRLMAEVCRIQDFSHLARLDGGTQKAKAAKEAVAALAKLLKPHQDIDEERQKAEQRKAAARQKLTATTAVQAKIAELSQEYFALVAESNHQRRGYLLENLLRELSAVFDMDPKTSFRIVGEQIDGAFSFDSTDYLFEAKWQDAPVDAQLLDALAGKVSRKLENTLGLYVSINGYSRDGITAHTSGGRRVVILADGSDLMAVLEGRIDLPLLLKRKKRHASETRSIYLPVSEIL